MKYAYECPVCGYNQLLQPPTDHMICPSCGTQFGYDDALATHAELREEWIANGARWWSSRNPPPPEWKPQDQLLRVSSRPVRP